MGKTVISQGAAIDLTPEELYTQRPKANLLLQEKSAVKLFLEIFPFVNVGN